MAVYTDKTKREFIDKKETNVGSVLQQLDEAESYLKLNNKVSGKIQGMERIDNYDYSEESIREILLNTIAQLNEMVERNLIAKEGGSRNTVYKI